MHIYNWSGRIFGRRTLQHILRTFMCENMEALIFSLGCKMRANTLQHGSDKNPRKYGRKYGSEIFNRQVNAEKYVNRPRNQDHV